MESDREPPAAARTGPSGRSSAARPGASRRGSGPASKRPPAKAAPAEKANPTETAADEPTIATPVIPQRTIGARPPVIEETVVEEPVVEEPVVEEPVTEEPAPEDPTPGEDSASGEPADDQPAAVETPERTGVVALIPRMSKAARLAKRTGGQPGLASGLALSVHGLTKRFGGITAVDGVDLEIPSGTFYGFVGPNGAGKTTTLAMITGLLRPDAGVVRIHGIDVWRNPGVAKRALGVLPDQLRLFDRLTGAEFLHHAGALRGLDHDTVIHRVDDLVNAFGLRYSLDRLVSDYSAGMVKKIAIAAAMIHSPRLLVLDEPFESVDPVSANSVIAILKNYAQAGGTVLLSSHSMSLIERTCDAVAIIADGRMLAAGPLGDVLAGQSLETRFVELAGGVGAVEGMEWLQSYSD